MPTIVTAEPMPATDRYPAGYMLPQECAFLETWAKDKLVLELGAFWGRSTIAMAYTARHVVTIDHGMGSPGTILAGYGDSLPILRANLRKYGVAGKVTVVVGELARLREFPVLTGFDAALVDAAHDAVSVRRDSCLAAGACGNRWDALLWDDYDWTDVRSVVDELASKVEMFAAPIAETKLVVLTAPHRMLAG